MKINANSEHSSTNRRPGPVNTNWYMTRLVYASPGSGLARVGKYKLGVRAGKYKVGARVGDWGQGLSKGSRVGKYEDP